MFYILFTRCRDVPILKLVAVHFDQILVVWLNFLDIARSVGLHFVEGSLDSDVHPDTENERFGLELLDLELVLESLHHVPVAVVFVQDRDFLHPLLSFRDMGNYK